MLILSNNGVQKCPEICLHEPCTCATKLERKQVIQVKKTRGAAAPHTRITWASFLGSEEPSLKLLRSAKLQRTNFSPISNCRRLKSAIFLSSNIKLQYKFIVAVTRRNTSYIYIYRALHTGSRNENNNRAACGSP